MTYISKSAASLQQYNKPRCKYEWYVNEEEYANINYRYEEAAAMRRVMVEGPEMRLQKLNEEWWDKYLTTCSNM